MIRLTTGFQRFLNAGKRMLILFLTDEQGGPDDHVNSMGYFIFAAIIILILIAAATPLGNMFTDFIEDAFQKLTSMSGL